MAAKKKTPKKKASRPKAGKTLVIVESPAKARTIGRFLGSDFMIEASVGHIRDLPANAAEIPERFKKEKWARLGIDIEDEFRPLYVVPKAKREHIRRLKKCLKEASRLYLATDEDREGEAISWHLVQELKPKVAVGRLVFHEITKTAIRHALDNPRAVNEDLVEAQETRRLVDRIYGYQVSPLLWKKIKPKLSAGRVQSVAVKLVVEREHERMRFHSANYWDVKGTFQAAENGPFEATLTGLDGRRVATGKDFDPETGKLKQQDKPAQDKGPDQPIHVDERQANELVKRCDRKPAKVLKVDRKPYTQKPAAPFTTSTLQQEAGRKLRFTAKRTMQTAQRLYENGYITYMRTDSTTLSKEALKATRTLIRETYGEENLPPEPRIYTTKVKNAQEAHEAIRPAHREFIHPSGLGRDVSNDERRVYELIWQRTVASQMKDAKGHRTTVLLGIDDAEFQATGRTIEFPGFRRAYVEDAENGDVALAETDRILPRVAAGDTVETKKLDVEGHNTQPPARLTEATLIKELEARGIGRPSTYASIIDTILAREYCYKKGTALVPTFTAFAVVKLLEKYLSHLVDYAFTAKMEDDLDEISNGRQNRLGYLNDFFHGNGKPGLRSTLADVEQKIDPREVCSIPLGKNDEGELVEVRVGRYGPYLSCDDLRVSVPDSTAPDELDLEAALELLQKGSEGPKSLGIDPDTGLPVYVKTGRFGPYFQLGDADQLEGEKPKMASLLRGMSEESVTLQDALAVLSLPRKLGVQKTKKTDEGPGEDEEVTAQNGRFGPYLRWGKETRTIPADESPLSITLERAMELFAQPKTRGGRTRAAPKVLKELGKHPQTGVEIKILDGRYGPYVADGTTNASIPRGESVGDVDLNRGVELLAERAARGPSPRKKKKAKKKKAAKKKPGKSSAKTSPKPKPKKKTTPKKKATA
ncbi:MAG: type I DNA topoisomerase [Planctomycetota bacterium]|jgi:DNA topoisomerase-1